MEAMPCTTDGCKNVKPFSGRCNPCQRTWELENLPPLAPVALTSWADECIAKVMGR